jgi:2Fe-2S ferredoxin
VGPGQENHDNMNLIKVEPAGIELAVNDGESIFAAAYRAGYQWPTMCKGMASCGACTLDVQAGLPHLGEMGQREREMLLFGFGDVARGGKALRLACQATVTGPGVVVRKKGVVARGARRLGTSEADR